MERVESREERLENIVISLNCLSPESALLGAPSQADSRIKTRKTAPNEARVGSIFANESSKSQKRPLTTSKECQRHDLCSTDNKGLAIVLSRKVLLRRVK